MRNTPPPPQDPAVDLCPETYGHPREGGGGLMSEVPMQALGVSGLPASSGLGS